MKNAEDIVREKGNDVFSISAHATIEDALKIMVAKKIGAILVEENGEIVGIWTERDLLRNSILDDFDPKTARIGDYMTKNLVTADASESIYRMMDKFLGLRVRHLPIKKDGKVIGLLSAGDVIKAALIEKTREFDELNEMVSWEYYENWRWSKK
ncbi:CBS domain-containing protein [candidate division KSB1 bacterium]|nr:CBS domain-containing protein [candidate division KSB1 bacterium]